MARKIAEMNCIGVLSIAAKTMLQATAHRPQKTKNKTIARTIHID